MLSITSRAADVVTALREREHMPEDFGVRVYSQASNDGLQIQLTFSEGPSEGDEVAEAEGTRLFVAPELVEPLADSVIDARETPEGMDLVLRKTGLRPD